MNDVNNDVNDEIDNDIDKDDDSPKETSRGKTRMGCAFALVYICMACMEVFACYEWLTWRFDLHGLLAAPVALVLGFVPGLGSLISYWTATEIWHWESWKAIAFFFWYYLPIIFIVGALFSVLGWAFGLVAWKKIRGVFGR